MTICTKLSKDQVKKKHCWSYGGDKDEFIILAMFFITSDHETMDLGKVLPFLFLDRGI